MLRASVFVFECFVFETTPDGTADGDLLFTFSYNILDYRRSLSSQLKFGSGTKTSCDFVASSAASRPEKLVALAFKTAFLLSGTRVRGQFVASPSVLALKRSKDMNKNATSTR